MRDGEREQSRVRRRRDAGVRLVPRRGLHDESSDYASVDLGDEIEHVRRFEILLDERTDVTLALVPCEDGGRVVMGAEETARYCELHPDVAAVVIPWPGAGEEPPLLRFGIEFE